MENFDKELLTKKNISEIQLANGSCLPTDQRGVVRPRAVICDIGAFEGDGLGGLSLPDEPIRRVYLPVIVKR